MMEKIYNGDIHDKFNLGSKSFLQVNSCGINFSWENPIITFRKRGRIDYHIVYVSEGCCEAEYDTETIVMKKGGFVLYPPNMPQRYKLNENSKTVWLHFNGYMAEKILDEAKLDCGVHKISFSAPVEKMLIQLISEHNRSLFVSNEKGILLSLLYTLGKLVNNIYSTDSKINDCISFIVTNYSSQISVRELAAYCNLSRGRFMHLFRETAGMPPHSYQQMLRINNSKTMLSSTDLSIAEISRLSGYDDPLYFSRLFKKITGLSPKQFRENTADLSERD
ncbi:MAG: helix-turn-helix domain-containing protein [Clostridia bacterium]|nr:helix-turn-helix domain-containing protein [Clostridia bacterium]